MNRHSEWIKETQPLPESHDIPENTLISITFQQEINRHTLNMRNILILNGNSGGRLISNCFLYRYIAEERTLYLYLKADAERLGSNNTIEIIVTGRISNHRNMRMEIPFSLRFTTQ